MSEFFLLNKGTAERLFATQKSLVPRADEQCTGTPRHWFFGKAQRDYFLNGVLDAEVKHSLRDHQMIWTQFSHCLVHRDLVDGMLGEGFTGFCFRPARVRFRDGYLSSDYQRLLVTGWGGMARKESGINLLTQCSACAAKRYSWLQDPLCLIDETQWSGEDCFFVWPLPTNYFVTARVAKFLKAAKVKTVSLQSLEEMADYEARIRPFLTGGISVGSLAEWLPEDLANRYGGPLGIV